jgi:hypothetical protein
VETARIRLRRADVMIALVVFMGGWVGLSRSPGDSHPQGFLDYNLLNCNSDVNEFFSPFSFSLPLLEHLLVKLSPEERCMMNMELRIPSLGRGWDRLPQVAPKG